MLIVVRHGRTEANASGLLLGRADPDLDDLGQTQAKALAAAVGPVDGVVTSPLRRTQQTAAAFGAPTEVDDRWIELDYGAFDGRPIREIDPEVWARWRSDPDFAPPGGESLAGLGARVRVAADALVASAGRSTIVVVTHVSPVKAAVAWCLGVDDSTTWRMWVAPASITRIAVGGRGPVLQTFNETAHLA